MITINFCVCFQKSTIWHPVLRDCEALRIETLMYTSRGRHFDLVGYVSVETGEILVLSDLFPNTKYGYNKRKFLVSTLHVSLYYLTT